MPSRNNEAEFEHTAGRHAAPQAAPLSKREQRRADKENRKRAKAQAREAKKAGRREGAAAPAIAATADEALGAAEDPLGDVPGAGTGETPSSPTGLQDASSGEAKHTPSAILNSKAPNGEGQDSVEAADDNVAAEAAFGASRPKMDLPEIAEGPDQASANAYAHEEKVNEQAPGSYDEEYGYIPVSPLGDGDAYPRYNAAALVGEQNAETAAKVAANRRRRRRNRIIAAVLVVILCLVGAGAAGAYVYMNGLNQNLAGDQKEAEEVKEVLTPAPIGDEPFYMLLMGCDDREGVEGTRADTTILARLDPKNNQVTLISIPRDTAIDIPGYGTEKFNAAYAYGGPSGTIEAASQLCGVKISHYAEVHFEALIDIVDYIGGVDVDVPIPIDDVDAGGKLEAGYQHLNGEQAMIFARSRSYANGDFQRTTSQRLLIEAAANKVMTMSPTELPGLLMEISRCMTTDLSVQELLGLATAFKDEPDLVIYSAMIPSTTAEVDGVSYVVADVPLLQEMMNVIDAGGDPASVVPDDYTVKSSAEAQEQGIELIVNYGDEVPDEGAPGYADYADVYSYDPNFYYYNAYSYGGDYTGGYVDDGSSYTGYDEGEDWSSYDAGGDAGADYADIGADDIVD